MLENVDLMDLMMKPAYDELRQAMARPPADRQAWAALYQKAARLAEVENLLFFRTRAEDARKSEWATNAARARQASADIAARSRGKRRRSGRDHFCFRAVSSATFSS
jgi:hypothetical protein